MAINGVTAPTSLPPIPPAQTPPLEEQLGKTGKAKGVIDKLQTGHFNAVANIRLRIAHFDNPDLEPIDPEPLPVPEDVPGKAYEKFLAQYQLLYDAAQASADVVLPQDPTDPDPVPEPLPIPISPPADPPQDPPVQQQVPPAVTEPQEPAPQEPTGDTPPAQPVIVPQLQVEPIPIPLPPDDPDPLPPVGQEQGALEAFGEILDDQTSPQEPETLDIVI